MNNTYEHSGKPLDAPITRELILELFSGQTVAVQTIKKDVLKLHLSRGGKRFTVKYHPVGGVLTNMERSGKAEKTDRGIWRIFSSQELQSDIITASPDAAKILGSGDNAVYLYYFPTYRLWAESQEQSSWPCKIGKTEGDTVERINIQVGTALPEEPEIALSIQTDKPSRLEETIHFILTERGRSKEDAPGTEWFVTSPSEVEEIYINIVGL